MAAVSVPAQPGGRHREDHPGDLLQQAEDLEARADQAMVAVRADRAEAAKLRAKAEAILTPGLRVVARPADHTDSLLAAAMLAVEDIPGTFPSSALAAALGIRDTARAARLCVALRELGHVDAVAGGWRACDPESARVRDAVIELGDFTREELAEFLEVSYESLTWYLAELRQKGAVEGTDQERMRYVPTGPERIVTRRRDAPTPEQLAATEVLSPRGQQLHHEDKAKKAKNMQVSGRRRKIEERDRARTRTEEAKRGRSSK